MTLLILYMIYGFAFLAVVGLWVSVSGRILILLLTPPFWLLKILLVGDEHTVSNRHLDAGGRFVDDVVSFIVNIFKSIFGLSVKVAGTAYNRVLNRVRRTTAEAGVGDLSRLEAMRERIFTPAHEELLAAYYSKLCFKTTRTSSLLHYILYYVNSRVLLIESFLMALFEVLSQAISSRFSRS